MLQQISDTTSLYNALDIVALTSQSEGSPLTIIEAAAHGLPVIATCVGGIPGLVTHGCNGILFEPGDRTACSDAILRLGQDAEKRKTMSIAARRKFEERLVSTRWTESHLDAYHAAKTRRCTSE
jgi:glycosyltransferase involved in cell wall biosynthesis